MKRVILILLLLFATILTACSDSPGTAQITQETQSSIENSIYSSKPDVSENETTEETSQAESSQEKTAEPIKTSTRCYDSNDSLMWYREIAISDRKNLTIYYDKNGNETSRGEGVFDENGNEIKSYGWNAKTGELTNIYQYSYDNSGNPIKEIIMDASGDLRYTTIFEYENGKMIRLSTYNSENELHELLEYEYDGENISKCLVYDTEDNSVIGYDLYEYNPEGLLSGVVYYYDDEADASDRYEYDSEGREIAYYYEESGQLIDYRLTEYTGNSGTESMIKTSFYNGNGELQRYTIWESFYE